MWPDMHRALEMAWFTRNPDKLTGPIFHSDSRSQYASDDFRKMLEHCTITPSMSRKSNCWDNACSETLFDSLKVERLHGEQFETIRDAKDAVIAWLLCGITKHECIRRLITSARASSSKTWLMRG